MASAAKRGRKRRRLDVTKSASIFVAVAGAILGLAIEPMIVGTAIMLAGGMAGKAQCLVVVAVIAKARPRQDVIDLNAVVRGYNLAGINVLPCVEAKCALLFPQPIPQQVSACP